MDNTLINSSVNNSENYIKSLREYIQTKEVHANIKIFGLMI